MKKSLKLAVLAFVLTLPALSVSAQSAATGDTTPRSATAMAAVPADNMLALLQKETVSEELTTSTSAAAVTDKEPTAAKSMSEELSAWVENKLAVVNSVKGLKRLK